MAVENPYLPPHAALLPDHGGLRGRRLRLLGWLALLAMLFLPIARGIISAFAGSADSHILAALLVGLAVINPIAEVVVFLGFGKLLRSRYGLSGLAGPIYLLVATILLGAALSAVALDWILIAVGVVTIARGAATIWLGIRMLKAEYRHSLLRTTGVLSIVAGAMTCSVIFVFLAALPLLVVAIMMAILFFRAARDISELGSASATAGSAPTTD